MYLYIYIYVYICIYTHIHLNIVRERIYIHLFTGMYMYMLFLFYALFVAPISLGPVAGRIGGTPKSDSKLLSKLYIHRHELDRNSFESTGGCGASVGHDRGQLGLLRRDTTHAGRAALGRPRFSQHFRLEIQGCRTQRVQIMRLPLVQLRFQVPEIYSTTCV